MNNVYAAYGQGFAATPQGQPIPGREAEMAPNHAGGFGFMLDPWKRLERFLVLGSAGGTYYVGAPALTAENATAAIACIKQDGLRAVDMAHQVNIDNRAPKTDPQLFVMALGLKHGDAFTKARVRHLIQPMLRTGTHLLHFVAMLDSLGGWNRSKRRIVSEWFTSRNADALAYQVVKYARRDGWAQRDVLRLAHPSAPTPGHQAVYGWLCGRDRPEDGSVPAILDAHARAHDPTNGTAKERALAGIADGLPREALPTDAMQHPDVWRELLPDIGLTALLRNLGNLTTNGVLALGTPECGLVAAKLTDAGALARARVHPFAILLAALVYRQGQGVRGAKAWNPVPAVLAALDDAYDLAFGNVAPTGKRMVVGIDISGSMIASCVGTPIPCALAAAALAVTLARLEPHALVLQFDLAVQRVVPVTKRTGISGLALSSGGGTDLAAPVTWALGQRAEFGARRSGFGWPAHALDTQLEARLLETDGFVILTDNETWAGGQHTAQAMEQYRRRVNPGAKLVCCSLGATGTDVVDPQDPLSLGCAGLDATLPALVADFIGRAA